jgi:hypothetical protein
MLHGYFSHVASSYALLQTHKRDVATIPDVCGKSCFNATNVFESTSKRYPPLPHTCVDFPAALMLPNVAMFFF